jgi:hypothetical protein
MVTQQPTSDVVHLRTRLEGASPSAPDRCHVEELEVRAAAAASYAALSVATEHWAVHGGDLAAHIRVALGGVRHI